MKRHTIISTSPYGRRDVLEQINEYKVQLESEGGYSEIQSYAATDAEIERILDDALDVFCAARAAINQDPLAFLR